MSTDRLRCHEHRLGHRKIYGIEREDGTCQILADCPLCQDACIKFTVPTPAARIYFDTDRSQRPRMEILFPDLRIEHRDILIAGTSPAEFDQINGKEMPKDYEEFKQRYAPLGYEFDDDEDEEAEEINQECTACNDGSCAWCREESRLRSTPLPERSDISSLTPNP